MSTSDISVTIKAKRSQKKHPPPPVNCQCEAFQGLQGLFVAFVHYKQLEESRKKLFS